MPTPHHRGDQPGHRGRPGARRRQRLADHRGDRGRGRPAQGAEPDGRRPAAVGADRRGQGVRRRAVAPRGRRAGRGGRRPGRRSSRASTGWSGCRSCRRSARCSSAGTASCSARSAAAARPPTRTRSAGRPGWPPSDCEAGLPRVVLLDHIAGQDTRAGTVPVVLDTVEVDLADVVGMPRPPPRLERPRARGGGADLDAPARTGRVPGERPDRRHSQGDGIGQEVVPEGLRVLDGRRPRAEGSRTSTSRGAGASTTSTLAA